MILRAWAAAAAAALALTLAPGDGAAQSCARDLPSVCLKSFGAGSIAASAEAQEAGCAAQLTRYRDCVAAQVRTQQGQVQQASDAPALSARELAFLKVLEAELADNVARLEALSAIIADVNRAIVFNKEWPVLRRQFFSATDNPAYLAAPPDWLARTQGFYADAAAFLAEERKYFDTHSAETFARTKARERLAELATLGREELLPEISAAIAAAGG